MPPFTIRRVAAGAGLALAIGALIAAAPRTIGPQGACAADNAGLTLPAGFCATIFADSLTAPRHMVVAPNGDLWVVAAAPGGRGGPPPTPPQRLYLLRDANGDGKAEMVKSFPHGGGSGIALANGALYASSGRAIVRYRYTAGTTELGAPDTIVSEFATGGHIAYNFVVVGPTLYMNVGSATNVCQERNQPNVKGIDPCVELETRAGVWTFDANRMGQKPADGQRFATGLRNLVALTVHPRDSMLWAAMHGRDNLHQNWGFSQEYGAENPAEQVNHIEKGDDFGWPYCYYSNEEKKLVTAPEYGGDGKKDDRCRDKKAPAYGFPGHIGPNDMLFYTGAQFPEEYRNGAFIAFHGSWNRAPLPQQGFNVAFLPMRERRLLRGASAGPHRVFAEGFSRNGGPGTDGRIHRPTGLAQATDGSLYVSDDVAGTIYRISFRGR